MNASSRERQIGPWGTIARLAVGTALLAWAGFAPPTSVDLLIGLVALPSVVIAGLALRGRQAQPLRAEGQPAHFANCAIAFALFTWQPVAAALSYGASMLLAASRGIGACEIFAVSNWLRRRDDRLGCPLFLPVDAFEASAATRRKVRERSASEWR